MENVIEGRGLALLPNWAVAAELADGRLQAIDLNDGPLSTSGDTKMSMYLLYHPPKFRLQKIKVTAEFLISELRRGGVFRQSPGPISGNF